MSQPLAEQSGYLLQTRVLCVHVINTLALQTQQPIVLLMVAIITIASSSSWQLQHQ